MIVKQTFRILSSFARLTRPMINKYQDVFELFKDYKNPMQMVEMRNSLISERIRKNVNSKQQLSKKPNTPKSKQYLASRILIEATGFSPSTLKQYKLVQNLQGSLSLDEQAQSIPLKYSPQKQNIKFHWSINRKVPVIETYKLDKTTAYIFNLPSEITQPELADALGLLQYQQIKIKQCLLGTPAYAVVKFKNEKFISERVFKDNMSVNYKDHVLELVTEKDSHKLGLERRQLVIKGIQKFATPVDFLSKLSKYGKVVHLDFPMQVYKEASVAEIKKLYKKEKYPIKLNIHRKNGTIQTEYYPPFEPSLYEQDILKRKEDEYKRKLKYCEDVDIHQGQQGKVFLQNRGYCVVTFSCQEEAQNCYLQNRFVYKMELKNDQDQFEFDEKHRMALLRHIDNSYIQNFLSNNPNKEWQQKNKQKDSIFFQSLFMNSVYNHLKRQMYQEVQLLRLYQQNSEDFEQQSQSDLNMHMTYKQFLNQMKNTIGKQLIEPLSDKAETSKYGKSFDQLAEQELFGMKLKQKSKKPRYEVNIDDYIRQSSKMQILQSTKRRKKRRFSEDDLEQLMEIKQQQQQQKEKLDEDDFTIMHVDDDVEIYPTSDKTRKFELFKVEQARQQAAEQAKQNAAPATADKGKRKFSTAKTFQAKERPKKYEQKVRSHMRYNRYVRNCINEYMGIFPVRKFEQQFRKPKPSFTNPQSLNWADGTQFITEDEVPRVMQYTTTGDAQKIYEAYLKQNQIAKSLNIDIEEHFLRNFEENRARAELMSHDFGFVKEEFEYKGDPAQIQQTLDNLNREAEFGQQFKLVQSKQDSKPKIVKIVKLESIVNIEKLKKYQKQISEGIQNGTSEIDPQKQKTIQKYFQYLWNGKPAPKQLCQALGLEQNTAIDSQKIYQDLYKQFKLTKKELENMLNIDKFSRAQIQNDIRMQLRIANQRKHLQAKKPTDYVRDTSDIKVKDRGGRAVVSKFRQI